MNDTAGGRGRRSGDWHRRDQRHRRRYRRHQDLHAQRAGRGPDVQSGRQLQLQSGRTRPISIWRWARRRPSSPPTRSRTAIGATDTATLTITVTGTNDAPDAVDEPSSPPRTARSSAAASRQRHRRRRRRDADLFAAGAGRRPDAQPSGNYTFDPSSYDSIAAGSTVTLVASYRVIDNNGATDTATITITINGINDAPDAVNDSATATEDGRDRHRQFVVQRYRTRQRRQSDLCANSPVAGLTINGRQLQLRPVERGLSAHRRRGDPDRGRQLYDDRQPRRDGHGDADHHGDGRKRRPVAIDDVNSAIEDGAIVIGNVGSTTPTSTMARPAPTRSLRPPRPG